MAGGLSSTRTADIPSTTRLITRHFCNVIIKPPLPVLHEDHCRKPHDMLKDYGSKELSIGIETMSRRMPPRYAKAIIHLFMRDEHFIGDTRSNLTNVLGKIK